MTVAPYPSPHDEHVEAVAHAVQALQTARVQARRVVREALAAGVPHSRIADELRANARQRREFVHEHVSV